MRWNGNRMFESNQSNQSNQDKTTWLLDAIKPGSRVGTKDVLEQINTIDASELEKTCQLQMASSCMLDERVKKSIGIQCLIYLFDPGNGWSRDYTKRGNMLIMAAKLVEKGVSLEGISYYGKTIKKDVQDLIDNKYDNDPPATLNQEVVDIFTQYGYDFNYPAEFCMPTLGR